MLDSTVRHLNRLTIEQGLQGLRVIVNRVSTQAVAYAREIHNGTQPQGHGSTEQITSIHAASSSARSGR